jgi:hypothetical protein
MKYKIGILNREYTDFDLFNTITLNKEDTPPDFIPSKEKIFTNDLIEIINGECIILHSTVRVGGSYPGILVLDQNKTYGRYNKRLLYKCIPDDKRIPIFLVPYEIKTSFHKKCVNKYITFKFKHWDNKHPFGTITNVIGDVNILNNFYEYQLYCKSLHDSIQDFTKATNKSLKKKTEEEYLQFVTSKYPRIEDRTQQKIISIDPENSKDFDDALGIIETSENEYILSIYIANVSLWLEILGLWNSFSCRISTIYLPDRKRPMLPTVLSDCLCSLQENEKRLAFCMDICIKQDKIENISYSNAIIEVNRNYRYDHQELHEDKDYSLMMKVVNNILPNYKYLENVKNSHDLVTYTMILMNNACAKKMSESRDGIYRSLEITQNTDIPQDLPKDIKKHMTIWYCTGGQYKTWETKTSHDLVSDGLEDYIHITSPIRRLVDLLNIMRFQDALGLLIYEEDAVNFYKKWLNDIDYINVTMRAIRRVQNDCSLLNMCFTDDNIIGKKYVGYIFDKLKRHDGLFQYMVYLPELKINNRFIHQESFDNYLKSMFEIFIFTDETSLKQKIRLQIIR